MSLLFQDKELMALMQDFYILTGIKIVLFDADYTELISYPLDKKTFCMYMRENEEFNEKCLICDKEACHKCKSTGTLEIYKCHTGLIEAVAPITENGKIIGYMMFGQVTDSNNKEEFSEQMQALSVRYNIGVDLDKSIRKIKYKNNRQILAAAKILDALKEYVMLKEMIRLSDNQLIDKIEKYIGGHLSEELSADSLCKEFGLCRTKLYEVMKQYAGVGVATYIRRKRLEKAKSLIKATEMKIDEISYAVGLSDYNYFLRMFKKEYGISPKRFAAQNR